MFGFLRQRRFWKRLAIGLGLFIGAALILNATLAWQSERRLQAKVAAIRAAGEPASIPDLAPSPVPDKNNAAAILRKLAPRLAAFANEHGRFFSTRIGMEYEDTTDRGELPNVEQIAAIRKIVNKYSDVDEAIAAAASCDKYASQLDYAVDQQKFVEAIIEHQSEVRQAARFLAWKTEIALAEGDGESAVRYGIRMLRLARLYENEPGMVNFLIGIAVRAIAATNLYDALSATTLPVELHTALDTELALHDDPERLRRAIITERALGAGWFDAVLEDVEFYTFMSKAFGWPIRNYQIGSLEMMDEQLRLAARPWHEVRKELGDTSSPVPPSGHGVIADLLMPAIRASFEANARSTALLRSLRIYNALRQFREQHGREARDLHELGLPAEATIDPYSGRPLKLKLTDDGWIVYAVMGNGIDDDGDFVDLKDYGVAPRKRRAVQ